MEVGGALRPDGIGKATEEDWGRIGGQIFPLDKSDLQMLALGNSPFILDKKATK